MEYRRQSWNNYDDSLSIERNILRNAIVNKDNMNHIEGGLVSVVEAMSNIEQAMNNVIDIANNVESVRQLAETAVQPTDYASIDNPGTVKIGPDFTIDNKTGIISSYKEASFSSLIKPYYNTQYKYYTEMDDGDTFYFNIYGNHNNIQIKSISVYDMKSNSYIDNIPYDIINTSTDYSDSITEYYTNIRITAGDTVNKYDVKFIEINFTDTYTGKSYRLHAYMKKQYTAYYAMTSASKIDNCINDAGEMLGISFTNTRKMEFDKIDSVDYSRHAIMPDYGSTGKSTHICIAIPAELNDRFMQHPLFACDGIIGGFKYLGRSVIKNDTKNQYDIYYSTCGGLGSISVEILDR